MEILVEHDANRRHRVFDCGILVEAASIFKACSAASLTGGLKLELTGFCLVRYAVTALEHRSTRGEFRLPRLLASANHQGVSELMA
jgi:hypothetical protein